MTTPNSLYKNQIREIANANNVLNVLDYGVTGDGTTDDTAAIQAIIDTYSGPSGITIYFPKGTYLITSTITIAETGTHLIGDGKIVSTLKFQPTAADTMLEFTKGASVIGRCSVRDFQILSTDTTYTKTAMLFNDITDFLVENIYIFGFNNQASVGIHLKGRDTSQFRNLSLSCARPILIDKNPNHAYLDADVINFHNINTASVGSTYAGMEFINDAIPFHITFTGTNVFAGGVEAIKCIPSGTTQNAHRFILNDIRHEQATGGGYSFDIQLPNVDTAALYNLELNNCKAETTQATTDGFRLKGVQHVILDLCRAYNNSADALNLDSCRQVILRSCTLGDGTTNTFTLASNMQEREVNNRMVNTWQPSDAVYFMTRPVGQMALWEKYGTYEFAGKSSQADATFVTIPNIGGNSGIPFILDATLVSSTYTEACRIFEPADGTTQPEVIWATSNFDVTAGTPDRGKFPADGSWSVYNTGTATRIYNNLNETATISYRIVVA